MKVPPAPPPVPPAAGVAGFAYPYVVGGGPGVGFGSGMSARASAKKKAPEPDSAAAAASRERARARRRRRAAVRDQGYADEFMAMNVDVAPDCGPPPGEEPVASTVTSDRGAGALGFVGTARTAGDTRAAGLTRLAGEAFGGTPIVPMMMPGSWDHDRGLDETGHGKDDG